MRLRFWLRRLYCTSKRRRLVQMPSKMARMSTRRHSTDGMPSGTGRVGPGLSRIMGGSKMTNGNYLRMLERFTHSGAQRRMNYRSHPLNRRTSLRPQTSRELLEEEVRRTTDKSKRASSKRNDDIEEFENTDDEVQFVTPAGAKTSTLRQRDKGHTAQVDGLRNRGSKSYQHGRTAPLRLQLEDDSSEDAIVVGSDVRKRKAESPSRQVSPPKKRKEKENVDENVHEISSGDEKVASRLKKKRSIQKSRMREEALQYVTLEAHEFAQAAKRDAVYSQAERRSKERTHVSTSGGMSNRTIGNFRERRKKAKSKRMFTMASNPHRHVRTPVISDDSDDSVVLNNSPTPREDEKKHESLPQSEEIGLDEDVRLEPVTTNEMLHTSQRRKKKSVLEPSKIPASPETRHTTSSRSPRHAEKIGREGVRPLRHTGSVRAEPKDLSTEVVVISDGEGLTPEKGTDDTDVLAGELSKKVEISSEERLSHGDEITTKAFYGTASSPEHAERGRKKKVKRRRKRTAIQESSEDDAGSDIRFMELSNEEDNMLRQLMFEVPKDTVITTISEARIDLKAGEFSCLRASRWLSDEIMNSFVALINMRNKEYCARPEVQARDEENGGLRHESDADVVEVGSTKGSQEEKANVSLFELPRPRAHVFNTFFFTRLAQKGYDYNGVKRWLRKAGRDVLKLDLIMFPINISQLHWVLAVIDMRRRKLIYCDSTRGDDTLNALPTLRRWLKDEVVDKHGVDVGRTLDIDSWELEVNPEYQPVQKDDGSCGIFTLYMAEYLERGVSPNFKQKNIRNLRKRTALFLKRNALPKA